MKRAPLLLLALALGCDGPAEPLCEITELPPPQLRLLTRAQYDATVADLLPAGDGLSCSDDAACDLDDESCVAGVCTADPCNLVTFVMPADDGPYGSVHVAGEFNGWPSSAGAGVAMTWVPSRNLYYAKHALQDGTWQYKFVVDESDWRQDPANPEVVDDGFGGVNSVLSLNCDSEPDDVATPSANFPADARPPHYPFAGAAQAGLVTSVHVEQYLRAGASLASRAIAQSAPLEGCSDRAACTAQWVQETGLRAFRRPLTADEQQRYVDLAMLWDDGSEGLSVALQAMLSSPNFLYRSEVGEESGDARQLSGYEVASELSYLLWGTMPDEALMAAAADGRLGTAEGVAEQARRLLDDPRAEEQLAKFGAQWLGVDAVLTIDKSPTEHPDFDLARRQALLDEAGRFVSTVLLGDDVSELWTADWTLVDAEAAAHYGVDGVEGISSVSIPGRSGVLGLPALLATYAHSDQTSPIRRGVMVRDRLLCQQLPAPPPDAGGVPEVDPDATTRERFAQHSSDPSCAACHRLIDPVGFGFEGFDEVGKPRSEEGAGPVDSRGRVEELEGLGSDATVEFSDLPGLGLGLAESEAATRCLARQWHRFAFAALDTATDQCAVDHLEAAVVESRDPKDLLIAVTQLPGFLRRSK